MKMYRTDQDNNFEKWRDWHVLTIAKARGAALEVYAWGLYGVDTETLEKLAKQANEKYEACTLYPKAPVSCLPFRYFHFMEEYAFWEYTEDMKNHLRQFLEINRNQVKSRKLLIDFHRDSDPVSDCYLTTAERVFNELVAEDEVDEIALMK